MVTPLLVGADAVRSASGILGDSVLLTSGRVVSVGARADLWQPGMEELSYPGATIVPGLGDAHFHPTGYAATVSGLNVHDASSIEEVVARVEDMAARLPVTRSVIGTRLDDQRLAERRLPTRHDLDHISHPVLLYRVCGHVAVANTAALEAAGIGPAIQDPAGGHFDRDETGIPTGILRETAIPLVSDVVGSRTDDLSPDEVLSALAGLHDLGLTRIGAMVAPGSGLIAGNASELDKLLQVAADLPIGIDAFIVAETQDELARGAAAIRKVDSPMLRFAGVKIFADGSFGGHTAAMREPFTDVPTTGTLRLDERAPGLAGHAVRLGGGVAIHAIGDRAVERVLDLMTDLVDDGADPRRLRIEHASVMLDRDRERMADLGIIASMQPAFVTSETTWLEHRLGPGRLPYTYAHRSIMEAGITVAGGSDCPVEQPSPLWGMYSARDRKGVVPSEELTAAAALGLFTDGVAAALGEPPPLSPGSPAHLTVLEADPIEVAPRELPTLGVRDVLVHGVPSPRLEGPATDGSLSAP